MPNQTNTQLLEASPVVDHGYGRFIPPYDRYPVAGTGLADLDLERFQREYVTSVNPKNDPDTYRRIKDRSVDEQLSIAMMVVSVDQLEATVLGILTYGHRPQDFLPNAYVQLRRMDGVETACNIMESADIFGTVQNQIDEINKRFGGVFSAQKGEIFSESLQYIIHNAVVHRDYEMPFPIFVDWYRDRVEILSPGGLFGIMNSNILGKTPLGDYRNPWLANTLRSLGYIEKLGRGLKLSKRNLQSIDLSMDWNIGVRYVQIIIRTK